QPMPETFKEATALRLRPARTLSKRVVQILDRLEKHYGPPKRPYPTDPYEMILHRNAGYPQSDERCDKGFQALKKQIGLAPKKILAASDEALRDAARPGRIRRQHARRDEASAARREKGAEEIPHGRRRHRGQDSALQQDRARRGCPVELRSRSAAPVWRQSRPGALAMVWRLPFDAGHFARRAPRNLRGPNSRVPANQAARGRNMQAHASPLRPVSCRFALSVLPAHPF